MSPILPKLLRRWSLLSDLGAYEEANILVVRRGTIVASTAGRNGSELRVFNPLEEALRRDMVNGIRRSNAADDADVALWWLHSCRALYVM